MTFGQGVPDAETLPQAFADATGYRLHVLNLAFPGYGPQQFLRALETDIFRDLLTEPHLFVFLTAPWHAERSACTSNFVLRAPRHVMVEGRPTHKDKCIDHWPMRLRSWLTRFAIQSVFFEPVFASGAGPADYVAVLIRAGQLARERYGVPTLILYQPYDAYVRAVFRGSIPHPIRLLCTLRRGRHLPRRNTRYQADATPYLGRTCTGWIAPAKWLPCECCRRGARIKISGLAKIGGVALDGMSARPNSVL